MAIKGPRSVLDVGSAEFPEALREIPHPPKRLYVLGDLAALVPGLAVVGARKATPYGLGCAWRFGRIAAQKGACIISGGARGCDSEAHRAALDVGGRTVVFLGGGCDKPYPADHFELFQHIVDAGGALVSEHAWDFDPRPFAFRARNRLIAGLAEAVLIVEAGLPSGTFSTADEALDAGKGVLVVPGAITSPTSRGSNRLLLQGATPVVDDESFEDALFSSLGFLKYVEAGEQVQREVHPVVQAVLAEPLTMAQLQDVARREMGSDVSAHELLGVLAQAESEELIARQPDGRWGPLVTARD